MRTIILILSFSLLLSSPAKAQEKAPLLIIGGAAVLIGGGIIWYRIKKKCEKIAAARTNAWPEELNFVAAGQSPTIGALFVWSEEGYCAEERSLIPPTRATLTITIDEATNVTTTIQATTGREVAQTWQEFEAEMAFNGLFTTDPESFSIDRHPCEPQQVPIRFDRGTKTVTIGHGGVTLTVERSADLREWELFASLKVPAGGMPLQIEDVTSERQFYRVSVR